MKPFRFGVLARVAHSRDEWLGTARRAETLGYATFLVPDHFRDQVATSVGLMAAAAATSTIRIGSLVYDNDFRHPAVVACAVVARRLHDGLARPFPDPPPRDAFGLRMAIWA